MKTVVKSGIAMAALLASTSALAQTPDWRISEASGTVSIVRDGRTLNARENATLEPGDIIRTGAKGRAVLVRGKEFVVVSPRAELQVAEPEKAGPIIQFFQNVGNALFKIEKKTKQHFGVKTPYLAAVVKGTTFNVSVTGGNSTVQVTEGAVEVATNDDLEAALITPGIVGFVDAGDLDRLVVIAPNARSGEAPNAVVRGTPDFVSSVSAAPLRGPQSIEAPGPAASAADEAKDASDRPVQSAPVSVAASSNAVGTEPKNSARDGKNDGSDAAPPTDGIDVAGGAADAVEDVVEGIKGNEGKGNRGDNGEAAPDTPVEALVGGLIGSDEDDGDEEAERDNRGREDSDDDFEAEDDDRDFGEDKKNDDARNVDLPDGPENRVDPDELDLENDVLGDGDDDGNGNGKDEERGKPEDNDRGPDSAAADDIDIADLNVDDTVTGGGPDGDASQAKDNAKGASEDRVDTPSDTDPTETDLGRDLGVGSDNSNGAGDESGNDRGNDPGKDGKSRNPTQDDSEANSDIIDDVDDLASEEDLLDEDILGGENPAEEQDPKGKLPLDDDPQGPLERRNPPRF